VNVKGLGKRPHLADLGRQVCVVNALVRIDYKELTVHDLIGIKKTNGQLSSTSPIHLLKKRYSGSFREECQVFWN
jgi:hypothetical protein